MVEERKIRCREGRRDRERKRRGRERMRKRGRGFVSNQCSMMATSPFCLAEGERERKKRERERVCKTSV